MQNQSIAAKIEVLRAAHRKGELASHEVVKAMGSAKREVASSWGPAMRR